MIMGFTADAVEQLLIKKMQLDIDVSPPAIIINFRLVLTHVTFVLVCIDVR